MRLDKFISNNCSISRSEVRKLVKRQAVRINDAVAKDVATQVTPADRVWLHDQPVLSTGNLYFMVHKPAGYVCANRPSNYPGVLDLLHGSLPPAVAAQDLQIAGRLDLDTTGLVLVTNDGQWNHLVTSPKTGCRKVYRVNLAEPFDPTTEAAFHNGILLEGEEKPTLPAAIEVVKEDQVLLSIQEGKYHQVKRMFAATGNHVVGLHRLRVGGIHLDESLQPGDFRPLTTAEISSVNGNWCPSAT